MRGQCAYLRGGFGGGGGFVLQGVDARLQRPQSGLHAFHLERTASGKRGGGLASKLHDLNFELAARAGLPSGLLDSLGSLQFHELCERGEVRGARPGLGENGGERSQFLGQPGQGITERVGALLQFGENALELDRLGELLFQIARALQQRLGARPQPEDHAILDRIRDSRLDRARLVLAEVEHARALGPALPRGIDAEAILADAYRNAWRAP